MSGAVPEAKLSRRTETENRSRACQSTLAVGDFKEASLSRRKLHKRTKEITL